MTEVRKAPRWAAAFLRALEGCGEVRRAAAMAGVDHTTAYNRRKSHKEFAEAWAGALAAFVANEGEGEEEPPPSTMLRTNGVAGPSTIASAGNGPPPHAAHGADLVLQPGADFARAARSGAGRWSAGAEKRFFSALADRANVRDAAAAAGFSTNAIYARRTRRPEFRRAWEAAIETGKARLQMLLMDAAEKAFDPELLEVAEEQPRVSVAEALNILKAREGKEKELRAGGRGWDGQAWEEEAAISEAEAEELRARFAAKLDRLLAQEQEKRVGEGWTRHGADLIPPGWVAGPGAPPAPDPEPERDIAALYRP